MSEPNYWLRAREDFHLEALEFIWEKRYAWSPMEQAKPEATSLKRVINDFRSYKTGVKR